MERDMTLHAYAKHKHTAPELHRSDTRTQASETTICDGDMVLRRVSTLSLHLFFFRVDPEHLRTTTFTL